MIYKPKGRAAEYGLLAANLYKGCMNKCGYCFVPKFTYQDRSEFHSGVSPKKGAIDALQKDVLKLVRTSETGRVFFSFACDPYPPLELDVRLTRQAIILLRIYGFGVSILTKKPSIAMRDFSLLNEDDLFGVTLTFLNTADSLLWEPGADMPESRIEALKVAHNNGIRTFASMEPVISPHQTLELIEKSAPYVDHFKVGKLNHESDLPSHLPRYQVDWASFAQDAITLLEKLGARYYIKKDLARYIGRSEGFGNGPIPL